MSREILINITPVETRVALVENGVPQEITIERSQKRGLVGNIYKAVVVRVLPGMQAAFLDIGEERTAFLHVDDLYHPQTDQQGAPDIQQLLRTGQEILVQVIKDPISNKGARLTAQLSLASRYLVYMDKNDHHGISQRIEDESERERLKDMLETAAVDTELQRTGGFILRTAADGISPSALQSDIRYLQRLWQHVESSKSEVKAPCCIYEELPLYKRALRDMASDEV